MSSTAPAFCSHSQFTGYEGYCVCIVCGWIIEYEDIKLEKNDASLKNYIKTALKQIPSKGERIDFDLGVTTQGTVQEGSLNRVKFTVYKAL